MASPGINLAPGTQHVAEARKRQRRLITASVLLITVMGIIWGSLWYYQQQLAAEQGEALASLRNVKLQIANLQTETDRILLFDSRLQALDQLLSNHTTWEPFFQQLESLLPPNTVLTSLNITSEEGKASISGRTPNIDEAAVALATLKSTSNPGTIFSSGTISGISREATTNADEQEVVSYVFSAELFFNPDTLQGQN